MKPLHRFARFHAYVAVCPLTALQFCLCYLQRCDRCAYILRYVQQCDRFNRYILSSTAVWPLWCIYTTVSFGLSSVRHFLFMAWYTFRCLFQAIYIYNQGCSNGSLSNCSCKMNLHRLRWQVWYIPRWNTCKSYPRATGLLRNTYQSKVTKCQAKWQDSKYLCVAGIFLFSMVWLIQTHVSKRGKTTTNIVAKRVCCHIFHFLLDVGKYATPGKTNFFFATMKFWKNNVFAMVLLISTYFLHSLLITYLKVTYVT